MSSRRAVEARQRLLHDDVLAAAAAADVLADARRAACRYRARRSPAASPPPRRTARTRAWRERFRLSARAEVTPTTSTRRCPESFPGGSGRRIRCPRCRFEADCPFSARILGCGKRLWWQCRDLFADRGLRAGLSLFPQTRDGDAAGYSGGDDSGPDRSRQISFRAGDGLRQLPFGA